MQYREIIGKYGDPPHPTHWLGRRLVEFDRGPCRATPVRTRSLSNWPSPASSVYKRGINMAACHLSPTDLLFQSMAGEHLRLHKASVRCRITGRYAFLDRGDQARSACPFCGRSAVIVARPGGRKVFLKVSSMSGRDQFSTTPRPAGRCWPSSMLAVRLCWSDSEIASPRPSGTVAQGILTLAI